MPKVLVTDIRVNVSERQRAEMGDLEGLARSIKEYGQLQPVLLDADHNLVAGFRRLTACVSLGMEAVSAEFVGQLDPIRAQEIELEENVRRHNLNWQEEAKAIAKIHRMRMERDPVWTAEKTAEVAGVSRRTVFNSLALTEGIEQHPEVGGADTLTGAMMRLQHVKSIEQRKEAAAVRQLGEQLGLRPKVSAQVVCGDALAAMKGLADNSVDFVVTNPPYGVEIENLFIGDHKIYEDTHKDIVPLVAQVAAEAFRVLKPDHWFVMFYPTGRLEEGKAILEACGFAFESVPCVWYKPNKFLSSLGQPYQQFSVQYETFFWGRKGDARFNKLRLGNVFVHDTPDRSDRLHPLQMPEDLWKEILEIGSVVGELVVEPFAGSGSCGVAAFQLDRSYLGFELSQEYTDRANAWLNEVQTGQIASAKIALENDNLAEELKKVNLQ